MRGNVARRAGIALLCACSAGCYRYDVAAVDRLTPESDVRARVSPGAAERLRAQLGGEGRVVEGRFLGWDGDRLLVEVPAVSEIRGMSVRTLHQRVDLDPGDILEIEVKALDRRRTYLVVGAGVAALAAVVIAQVVPGGGSRPPGGGDPPAEFHVPLGIRLPIGR